MTWKVPGAAVEVAEFPPGYTTPEAPPAFAVRLELDSAASSLDSRSIVLHSDTAMALAAALVDAASRCDERTAHAIRTRARVARQDVAAILSPEMVRRPPTDVADYGGYREDLRG